MNRQEPVVRRGTKAKVKNGAPKQDSSKKRIARSESAAAALLQITHHRPELTQDDIAHITGLSRSIVQHIKKGKRVKPFTALVLRSFAASHTPPVWPADLHAQFEQYKLFERTLSRDEFKSYIKNLSALLEGNRELDGSTILTAGYLWLLAWISHDLAIAYGEDLEENTKLTLSRYEKAIAVLASLVASGEHQYAFLLDKAKFARWVSFYAARPEATRTNDPVVVQWVTENGLLKVAYACAEREPYEWSAIRNGLVIACILRRIDDCRAFHRLLVAADPNFNDLSFVPMRGVKPLSQNTDVAFYLANKDS